MKQGVERKCRTCAKWTFFPASEESKRCPICGKAYGQFEIGMDVATFRAQAPDLERVSPRRAE